MSYRDWDREQQELFDTTPGVEYLSSQEREYAAALFEEGFTYASDEYDERGLTPEQVHFLRDEFFDFLYINEDQFDWNAWREALYGGA